MTPLLFHPNFGTVPVGPDRRCLGQFEQVA